MIPFEEIQEQCVQNKEKVDKYSKIISISLFFIFLFLISYYDIPFYNNKILSIAGLICCNLFIIFALSNERIYSKLPAILGACLIVIANVIAIKDSFFSNGLTAKNLIVYVFNTLSLWVISFFIHCIFVYILGHTIFKNNKVKYTARIIKLEDSVDNSKNSHTYYAHFYDYTNKKKYAIISKKEYKTWKEGDYIETILQPRIDGITVKKIKHLASFNGKTDMEIFQERHKKDVELFGKSQEEMDAAKGEHKIGSYVIYFILLGFIDIFVWAFGAEYFDTIMSNDIIYALTSTIALAIPIYISYKEYSMIKTKGNYTLEDLAIWKDFLVPRCLFYFIISFTFIGGLISIIGGLVS